MWVDDKRHHWFYVNLIGGRALQRVWPRALVSGAVGLLVTVLYEFVPSLHISLTQMPFTVLGLALSVFLGFRNTTSYDRFWEGRKLWGQLVNVTRSISRQVTTLWIAKNPEDAAERAELERAQHEFLRRVIAYVHVLRRMLRDEPPLERVYELLSEEEIERLRPEENVPYGMLQLLGERLQAAYLRGWVHPQHVVLIEQSLAQMTDVQGGCERIKSTPLPFSYTVLMHRLVAAYCIFLPFGLDDSIGWARPAVVLAVSYAFFGLDEIGEEIEDPFGRDMHDLPLAAISRNIERNLRRRVGDPVPEALQPRDHILT